MTQGTLRVNGNGTTTVLAMAMELSRDTWKLAFSGGQAGGPRVVETPAFKEQELRLAIAQAKERFGLPEAAPVVSCQEAGRDGFSVHRFLEKFGIASWVVDSASIEVSRLKRRAKTDRLDAVRLLRLLLRHLGGEEGIWSVVRVPAEEVEDERRLHRERECQVKDRIRHTNRIRSHLAVAGLRWPVDASLPKLLKSGRTAYGTPIPAGLKAEILREYARLELVEKQLGEIDAEMRRRLKKPETAMDQTAAGLAQLRGVGVQGGWILSKEFFGWRRFRNRREVGAAAGLTGTPYNTGQSDWEQGISKAGNRRVRAIMTELAWAWIRFQPTSELTLWWEEKFAGGGKRMRRKGIVAVARKLLVKLWQYLEYGVVPEGAVLKAATAAA